MIDPVQAFIADFQTICNQSRMALFLMKSPEISEPVLNTFNNFIGLCDKHFAIRQSNFSSKLLLYDFRPFPEYKND